MFSFLKKKELNPNIVINNNELHIEPMIQPTQPKTENVTGAQPIFFDDDLVELPPLELLNPSATIKL